jgi:hypothetical protein
VKAIVGRGLTPEARMLLLMNRCGFMGDRRLLTAKGRGLLPEWAWRAYVKIRCELDMGFRRRVIDILEWSNRNTANI